MRDVGVDEIRGMSVLDRNGMRLGHVKDVTFDPEAWRVTGLRVGLDREAADRLRVPHAPLRGAELTFASDRVRSVGDAVILNVDERGIADLMMRGS
jgi:sporulation protein YlmC with PRC-barrel domain